MPQAYTCKRRILIQVLPPPNLYTKSANACTHFAKSFCCLLMHICIIVAIRPQCVYHVYTIECWIAILRQNAYTHEQITKGLGITNTCISRFGIHIGRTKYLNEYMPFASVSLWYMAAPLISAETSENSSSRNETLAQFLLSYNERQWEWVVFVSKSYCVS